MPSKIQALIAKIRRIGEAICENQMYLWPGFDPMDPDPEKFFKKQGIEYDGILYIRYPMSKTWRPMTATQIERGERLVGAKLPTDYKQLLQELGPVHFPGHAAVILETPAEAVKFTRAAWGLAGKQIPALAISGYNDTSDGNSIGFVRKGDEFQSAVFEFDHELRYLGNDDPAHWTKQVGNSLSALLLDYLKKQGL